MHGDFSRGHRPDARRGFSYTRGFAQQRRLLLDSDLNAMTDALHERLRRLANHAGCPAGSPDLGFLLTPGALLALFHSLEIVSNSSNVTFYRDYSRKYLDRFPSLYVAADQGAAGSITLRLRSAADGSTAFWCRAEAATPVVLSGGVNLNVPAGDDFQRVTANLVNVTQLEVSLSAGQEIWIGLIESSQNATLAPAFSIAAGQFYLNGLLLSQPADSPFTGNRIPPQANLQVSNPLRNLQNGDLLLAYLEGWERHVSFVEDPGVLENALGGDSDTTTRGRAVGQVKLALADAAFDPAGYAPALHRPVLAGGTLNVTTPLAPINPDPCALPTQGGYTGSDNRLYRFEVHTGGPLGTALLKWSRDNGAELFSVTEASNNQTLVFPAGTALQPGDLVEVLTADSIELGDAAAATLDSAGSTFTPSARATGVLALLSPGASNDTGVSFTLRLPDGSGPTSLPAHYLLAAAAPLKVRRWHGLIQTVAAPVPNVHEIENGIEVEINGAFSPLDYWQYEARAGADNANGPFQVTPHGPERNFAPLALFRFQAANAPLVLEQWLDHRFPPLCGLTADDIAFDGARIGSESDTVQEVIEELWERSGGGCCEYNLEPSPDDTAQVIGEILLETSGDVTICFKPGIYKFASTVQVAGRKVVLKGCPRAVFADSGDANPMFAVLDGGRLELANLVLFARGADQVLSLVELAPSSDLLEARSIGFFLLPGPAAGNAQVAIRGAGFQPAAVNPNSPVSPTPLGQLDVAGPAIRLEDCAAAAGWCIAAPALSGADLSGCLFYATAGVLHADILANASLAECGFTAGVSLAAIQAWTPEDLLASAGAMLEKLAAAIAGDAAQPGSICLRSRAVLSSCIQACALRAGVGLAATQSQDLDLAVNSYDCLRCAVYLFDAEAVRASEERIAASSKDSSAFGIQLLRSGSLTVSGCLIDRCDTAIALGAASAGQASRLFSHLDIRGNFITGARAGIVLGPASGAGYTGQLRDIAFDGNSVSAALAGFLLNARNGGPGKSITQVRAAGNTVVSRLGFGVLGADVELHGNRIRLIDGKAPAFGVIAEDTTDLTVESCQVEVSAVAGPDSALGDPVSASQAAAAGHFAQYIASTSKLEPAAIVVLRGSGARLSANSAAADGTRVFTALGADSHRNLTVGENEFLCGPVRCTGTTEAILRGNHIAGELNIAATSGGVVSGNRVVRRSGDYVGRLQILSAQGSWQVLGNRADSFLRISPATRARPGFNWADYFDRFAGRRVGAANLTALSSIRTLAADNAFNELVETAAPEPAAAQPEPAGAAAPLEAAYVMANPNWVAGYTAAVEDVILGGLFDDIVAAIPDLPDIVIVQTSENAYQLLFANNWAQSIQVGNRGAIPSAQSVIQVIGNRAEDDLRVLAYPKMVLALNAADDYPAAGGPTVPAVTQANIEF